MIDLLGLDLDGTLLSKTKKINNPSKLALTNLIAKKPSLKVMILTGRSVFSTLKHVEKLNSLFKKPIVDYFCCYGGAKLYQIEANKPQERYKFCLENSVVETTFSIIKKHRGLCLAYLDSYVSPYLCLTGNKLLGWFTKYFWYRKRCVFFNQNHLKQGILKISVYFLSAKRCKKVYEILKNTFQEKVNVLSFSNNLIEITHHDANKGYAIEYMAKREQLSLNRIAVIGDSWNDYAMFKKAKYSFAMSKSPSQLKLIATNTSNKTNRYRFSTLLNLISETIINQKAD
ncbi:Cof-like hydrolase [Mycoplasmoides genitalium M2288]|uniref:Cof-type HAD-IIB family hydrolase n=1 Tax=Mycoplasmoides genitalium TaxID=2097 RepID=UPI00027B3540|nr:Cof-type HAD-IIB family hydrolase [Mycoplasmoides genitalium]AFQ04432.1 Cof-like hydrolase [Mycoplasmoides genitalium M2288]